MGGEDSISSTELQRLIEKVKERQTVKGSPARKCFDAIKSYLSGDPEPLKKLAGEK